MHYETRLRHIVELGLPPFPQAVLIALNRYAHHKTHRCHPALETLAQRAVMHRNTVWRVIKALEKAGHISVRSGEEGYTVSEYVVLPRMLEVTPKVTRQVTPGVTKQTTTTVIPPRKLTRADFAGPVPDGWCKRCKLLQAQTTDYCFSCYAAVRRAEDREIKHMRAKRPIDPSEYPI